METKHKNFDAVLESRKWREAAGRKLNAMTLEERMAHLDKLVEQYAEDPVALFEEHRASLMEVR